MLSEKMMEQLNDQMMFEFSSGHIYLAMSAYSHSIDLAGVANFFMVQFREEYEHGMKFYHYILSRDGNVEIAGIPAPKTDYQSLEDVFNVALKHEQTVTQRIHKLMDTAIEENDYATQSFLKWFIDEQVEEEANFTEIIKRIRFVGDSKQGIFMLNHDLGERKFGPDED